MAYLLPFPSSASRHRDVRQSGIMISDSAFFCVLFLIFSEWFEYFRFSVMLSALRDLFSGC